MKIKKLGNNKWRVRAITSYGRKQSIIIGTKADAERVDQLQLQWVSLYEMDLKLNQISDFPDFRICGVF